MFENNGIMLKFCFLKFFLYVKEKNLLVLNINLKCFFFYIYIDIVMVISGKLILFIDLLYEEIDFRKVCC